MSDTMLIVVSKLLLYDKTLWLYKQQAITYKSTKNILDYQLFTRFSYPELGLIYVHAASDSVLSSFTHKDIVADTVKLLLDS